MNEWMNGMQLFERIYCNFLTIYRKRLSLSHYTGCVGEVVLSEIAAFVVVPFYWRSLYMDVIIRLLYTSITSNEVDGILNEFL